MNEKKLKEAFKKIKIDMDFLKDKISTSKVSKKSKNQINEFDIIKEDIEKLKTKIKEIKNGSENAHLDQDLLNTRFNDFKEVISKRIDSEINTLKFNVQTDIEKIAKDTLSIKKELSRNDIGNSDTDTKIQNTFDQFTEIIDEKLALEVNAIKVEFTEEIAKLYDRFFNEIVEFKGELDSIEKTKVEKKKTKKSKQIENPKKIENKVEEISIEEKPIKKESKLKKVAKWLFVDEDEEDEIANIKNEIKKQ